MWIEWTIGRHGGSYGHGSTPGMFHRLWKHPVSKYLGIFGVLLPAMIGIYYIYIESWSLGYAVETITGSYWGRTSNDQMAEVFTGSPGKYVPLSETIRGFKMIAAGECDHLPEQAFYMVGTIDEAFEKAKKLA